MLVKSNLAFYLTVEVHRTMAHSRGESRVSYAESAVVKHGIGDTPDLHPAQMMGQGSEVNAHRTVTFNGTDQPEKVGSRDIKKTDLNLIQRLYFTPNDSQVVRIVQNKPTQKTLVSKLIHGLK